MAIERNFTGYEFADFGELNYGTGGVISGALNAIVAGSARSGNYYHKLAASTNASNLCSFPAGTIVGTSGTVTSGNHKRVSVRAYMRIESAGGNGQIRLMGFGNDAGTCTVQFGAQNTSGGFLQPGNKLGLRIGGQSHNAGAVGAYPWGSVDLTVGVWYRLLLDIDLDVTATTVLSATLRCTEDSDSPTVDFTLTNSTNIGATDNIDKFALGYSNATIGAFGRVSTFNWDDIVYIATSDADAVSGQPTLPTQTHIYAIVPPTGVALNQWSGTYSDVDEYPVSGADTMSSSTAAAEVDFTHGSGLALGYSQIQAQKLYVNALVSGAGTGAVQYLLNGTAKAATLGANYPGAGFAGVDPIGGVDFTTLTSQGFAAATFGIRKNNGTQATVMANIGLEVIGTLAAYGSGNQIRGETQIKAGSIYDAQIADGAGIKRSKIEGGGGVPVFFPEEPGHDDWMIPGPPGSAASVRIPVVPVFFPDDPPDEALLMAQTAASSGGGGGSTTNNYAYYGGAVLLCEKTASASASLDCTLRNVSGQSGVLFQSDFDEYLVEFLDIQPATNSVGLRLRVSTDGGATWAQGASDYRWSFMAYGSGGPGNTNSTGATSIDLIGFANISNNVLNATSGFLRVFNPLSTVNYKGFHGHFAYWDLTPTLVTGEVAASYQSTTPANAMQFFASSGNLTSGKVRVYGIPKTPTTIPQFSSGGLVLIAQSAFSGVANVDFVSRNVGSMSGAIFQSDFDEYVFEILNVLPATNAATLCARYSTDGGATFAAGASDYKSAYRYDGSHIAGGTGGGVATRFIILGTLSNTATGGTSGYVRAFGPANTSQYKQLVWGGGFSCNDGNYYHDHGSGVYVNTAAVNAIRFLMDSGNMSGAIRVYGVDKTGLSAGSSVVAGSLSISADAASGAVNLTTQGTYDWGAPTNNATPLGLQQMPYPNRKLYGRAFLYHWWIAAGLSMSSFTGALATSQLTCTAADNMAGSALSAFATGAMIFNGTAGVTGYGFGLQLRAGQGQRTAKISARMWSGVYTITAHLSDGSAADVTATYDTGAGAGAEREWTITYNASKENEILTVTLALTTNRGSSPHVGLVYFSVA